MSLRVLLAHGVDDPRAAGRESTWQTHSACLLGGESVVSHDHKWASSCLTTRKSWCGIEGWASGVTWTKTVFKAGKAELPGHRALGGAEGKPLLSRGPGVVPVLTRGSLGGSTRKAGRSFGASEHLRLRS